MNNIDVIKPIYYIDDKKIQLIKKIENKLALINIDNKKRNLKRISKIRSVYSSLAIEENSITYEFVENIIDDKLVIAGKKEIQEVKNLNETYEYIKRFDYRSEDDLKIVHSLIMRYYDEDYGYYRDHGEGVSKNNKIIFVAPNSSLVPSLIKSLFQFINENDNIHPLILTNWNTKFEYIPIEEEIYLNKKEYYESINKCHINQNVNCFIDFILKMVDNILSKTTQKTTQKIKLNNNQLKIIKEIKNNPYITKKELAKKLSITEDGVKYNIKKLISNNIIKREGPDKGGYWELMQ